MYHRRGWSSRTTELHPAYRTSSRVHGQSRGQGDLECWQGWWNITATSKYFNPLKLLTSAEIFNVETLLPCLSPSITFYHKTMYFRKRAPVLNLDVIMLVVCLSFVPCHPFPSDTFITQYLVVVASYPNFRLAVSVTVGSIHSAILAILSFVPNLLIDWCLFIWNKNNNTVIIMESRSTGT